MSTTTVLTDAFGRIQDQVHAVLDGLTPEQLAERPGPDANPIGWLVWHLTRIQDDHVAGVAEVEQRYTADGWAERLDLHLDNEDTGWNHTTEQVGLVQADAETLRGYHDAVHAATLEYLATLTEDDLEKVVDDHWDPPVTLAQRLVSVISDDLQHVGQAAYVRGLLAN